MSSFANLNYNELICPIMLTLDPDMAAGASPAQPAAPGEAG
jgi:hypothetical protein